MEKKHFVFKLIPPRPTFPADMTEAERGLMHEHIAYWKDLTEKGISIIFGPVFDPKGGWGLGIIETEDETTARVLADNDPTIKAALGFTIDIYPMRVGMMRNGLA